MAKNNVDKARRERIKLSAELAREQVKAAESKRMLAQIKELDKAKATIKELRSARFARSRTGRLVKLGSAVFKKGISPAAKGSLRLAGKAGARAVESQVKAAPRRRKRKQQEDKQFGLIGGFDPAFRFV